MESRYEAGLTTLLKIAKKAKKRYCYPKQVTVENLLKDYHGIEISNRTLNRDLRWLEDNGYINRTRRTVKPKGEKRRFTSTLYKFCGKTFNWLVSLQNLSRNMFTHFRLPKWADNQISQKRASAPSAPIPEKLTLIREKDGSVKQYNPLTGELVTVKT